MGQLTMWGIYLTGSDALLALAEPFGVELLAIMTAIAVIPILASIREVSESDVHDDLRWLVGSLEEMSEAAAITDRRGHLQFINDHLFQAIPELQAMSAENNLPSVLISKFVEADDEQTTRSLADTMEQSAVSLAPQSIMLGHPGSKSIEVVVYSVMIQSEVLLLWTIYNTEFDQKMIQRDEHLRKMETITRFAGGMAHEFNNILTAIIGNLELIRSDTDRKVSDVLQSVESAEVAALRASQLIHELRRFSSRELPSRVVRSVPRIVRRVQRVLAGTVSRNISVKQTFEGESDLYSNVDTDHLQEALLKLGVNAVEAIGSSDGEIHFDVRCNTEGDGRRVQIDIRDTGSGMSAATREHAFEPLFTRRDGGTARGLGMSIAHGLIEEMDGEVLIQKTSSAGTVIRVLLPLTRQIREDNSDSSLSRTAGTGLKVATVDNESSVRSVLTGMLQILGNKVMAYSDGHTLLEMLKGGEEFDVIVLDYVMPGMTGRATYEAIRAVDEEVAVIICSGLPISVDQFNASGNRQPDAFLRKPFSLSDLSQALSVAVPNR